MGKGQTLRPSWVLEIYVHDEIFILTSLFGVASGGGGGLGFILAVFRGAVVGFIFNNICFYGKILYISLCYLPKISLK